MRLTIIPSDSFVAVDGLNRPEQLDLSSCNIPTDVHALQWFDTKGWVEFNDEDPFTPKPANQVIGALPVWANVCVEVFNAWTPPPPPDDIGVIPVSSTTPAALTDNTGVQ